MALYDTGLWVWDGIPPHEPVEFGVRFLWKWVGVAMPGPMGAGQSGCDFGLCVWISSPSGACGFRDGFALTGFCG